MIVAVALGLALLVGLAILLATTARRSGPLLVVVFGGVGVTVLAVVALGVGVPGDQDGPRASAPTTRPSEPVSEGSASGSDPVLRASDSYLRAFDPEGFPPEADTVDSVEDGQEVVVALLGFEPSSIGSVHQCPAGAPDAGRCGPGLPVTFDDAGGARVGVEVQRRFRAVDGRSIECSRRVRRCAVVVFGTDRGQVLLAFDGPAGPDASVRLSPGTVIPGGVVQVTVAGAQPDRSIRLSVCSAQRDVGVRCHPVTGRRQADETGSLTADVTIGLNTCRRGRPCAIAVTTDDGAVQLGLSRLSISGRPGAAYDSRRLLSGLLVAAALALLGWGLVKSTDWTAVEGDPFEGIEISDPGPGRRPA
ncbi:MAG: hypothetical protein WKF43_00590 [Acidimicrobiales bacterium]